MNLINKSELKVAKHNTIRGKPSYAKDSEIFLRNKMSRSRLYLQTLVDEKTPPHSSIFLSHSHSDKELIVQCISIFIRYGIYVYVDWIDDELTEPPSNETAERIKSKIKTLKKFVLLASNKAIDSKWCNWELGLGDAAKFDENIALFPISDTDGYDGNEYLRIYPYIEKSSTNGSFSTLQVTNPQGGSTPLEKWLIE